MEIIEKFRNDNKNQLSGGVYYVSNLPKAIAFEDLYIKMRILEGRIYNDEEVRGLPVIGSDHKHYNEWRIRKKSLEKLIKYLTGFKRELTILDLGCGNGWLSNKLSEINGCNVFGVDINQRELEQAARVFGNKDNLIFVYADIFDSLLNDMKFDIIVLAGVLMYFKNIKALINELGRLLNDKGEIHILDNAFYTENNVDGARERSLRHYQIMGFPEMSKQIYHHLLSETEVFKPEIIYNPESMMNKIKRKIFKTYDSPFYWMKMW